ncbi:MAG: glycosyltransferase family 2 protein [Bacteroidales bacterium]|nr:glycosyltransferase family 2 protein [Bacteroidales bacterium]
MVRVSILVPIYNVERYLERCLISIFEQTYKNIQYVFVNDCSTDNSESILTSVIKKYPERNNDITIISHSSNKGLASSRKDALRNVTGDYFINVDSDDYIAGNAVEIIANKVDATPSDIIVFNGYEVIENKLKILSSGYIPNKKKYLRKIILNQASPSFCLKAFNTEFFNKSNILPIDGVDNGEDFSTVTPLVYLANKIDYIDEGLYYYNRDNSDSYTQSLNKSGINQLFMAAKAVEVFLKERSTDENIDILIAGMKIRIKNYLYRCENISLYPCINELFPEIKQHHTFPSYLPEKILSSMAERKMYNAALIYIRLTKAIK